jgi:hypothetical protein
VVAVFLPVDDEFFLGFAVVGYADDGVLVALEVPVYRGRSGTAS